MAVRRCRCHRHCCRRANDGALSGWAGWLGRTRVMHGTPVYLCILAYVRTHTAHGFLCSYRGCLLPPLSTHTYTHIIFIRLALPRHYVRMLLFRAYSRLRASRHFAAVLWASILFLSLALSLSRALACARSSRCQRRFTPMESPWRPCARGAAANNRPDAHSPARARGSATAAQCCAHTPRWSSRRMRSRTRPARTRRRSSR